MSNQLIRFQFTIDFSVDALTDAEHNQVLNELKMAFTKQGSYQYERATNLHAQGAGYMRKSDRIRVETLGGKLHKKLSEYTWFKHITVQPETNNGFKKNALGRYNCKQDATYVSGPYEWGMVEDGEYVYKGQDIADYKLYGHAEQMNRIILDNMANTRSIIWFHDPYTGIGKSEFCRWFTYQHALEGVLQMNFSDADRMCMVFLNYCKANKRWPPKWVWIDMPYGTGLSKRDYTAAIAVLEQIKARWVATQRYEGKEVRWHYNTTVIVTSNQQAPKNCTGRKRFIEYKSNQVTQDQYEWVRQQ